MALGTALAVIGGLLLLVGLLAVLGLSSIVPGDAVASGIQGIFQVFFNWWQLWLPILIIGLVAYIARSGRGGNSTVDTAIGAAEGVTRGLRGDGGDPEPDPTPEPPTNPPTNPPSTPDDDTGGGDDSQSQQQQQMQQMMMALLQGNLSQGGNGNFVSYGPQQQQQQQQQMFGGLSPGVYSTFMQQINMMQINQQTMMQQMMQFMQQNNYQKVDNQFIIQFMKQVLDVDIDEGDVKEGDVIVQINQVIQQINITQIEQNIEKIIQEVNITNMNYIEQFMEILISIKEGDIKKEGDVIVILTNQEIRINSATLLTFLNILQVVKYSELKQILIALIEMPQSSSWEVKIEKLIVVYRESGEGESRLDIDLSGTNWEVFLRTIEHIDFQQDLKREVLAILRENKDIRNLNLSIAEVANIRDCIKGMPKEDVPKAGQEFVNYVVSNNGLNSETIENFLDYLLSKWPVNREYLKNENHYQSMATPNIVDGTEERLQEIIGQIENQEQVEKHVIELDEDAVNNLKKAINAFERERNFINAVRQISTDLDNNSIGNIGQQIREINEELGENLFDEENARQHIQDLENMSQRLEEAVEDLKEADHELEQVKQSDIKMEDALEQVEQRELQMTKAARTVLQKIHN